MFGDGERIRELTNQVERLQAELIIARSAGAIATDVERVLTYFNESGQPEEAAKAAAVAEVSASHKARLVETRKDALLAEKGEEFADTYRREEGPRIRATLDQQFRTDGTYETVSEQVQGKVNEEIRAEVISAEEARVRAELDTPETREAYTAQIRDGVARSADMQAFRQTVRAANEQVWKKEVEDSVSTGIQADEADREPDFKTAYEGVYRDSSAFKNRRDSVRAQLEREWRDATAATIAEKLGDEELRRLLDKKAQLAKEQLERETKAAELLRTFETSGINMTVMEKGSKLTVQLGTITKARNDGYGGNRLDTLDCMRTLEFIVLGDGKFKVRSDSISTSKSPWERDIALKEGHVLGLGNELSENSNRVLEPYLAADTYLHYDDDTTTPSVFDRMPIPVANVIIDGVSARTFEKRN